MAIGAVIVLVPAGLIFAHRLNGTERDLLARAPQAADAAGCGAVTTAPPYPGGRDRSHVADPSAFPPLSTYPTTPPASGPHAPVPVGAGVYDAPPPVYAAIHSLEHAAVTIWYSPSAAADPEVTAIKSFFAEKGERNHVIVAPYDYPAQGVAGALPTGITMALVAWHHVQTCALPSLAMAFSFVHAYRFNIYQWGAYRGDAPERFAPI